jgi:hypothetical protein
MNGCKFDYIYNEGLIDSNNTVSCYATEPDSCGAFGGTSYKDFCSQNLDKFTCPPGTSKYPGLNAQNIVCSVEECERACFVEFTADKICTYNQPSMDEETMASCCTGNYEWTSGTTPICAAGYCSQNTDPGGGCVTSMTTYCTKYGPSNNNCKAFMLNTANQAARESILKGYFQNQLQQGNKLTNPNNSLIAAICTQSDFKLGSLCDQLLSNHCKGITGRAEIFDNPDFTRLCGCHLDSSVYLTSSFDPSGLCDPICNLTNTVKNNNQKCKSNVCIFDSDIVNLIVEKGQISVNDICGQDNNNRCYFSKNILSDLEKYKDSIDFASNCQTCYSYDPTQKNIDSSVQLIQCVGTKIKPQTIPTGLIVAGVVGIFAIVGLFLFLLI